MNLESCPIIEAGKSLVRGIGSLLMKEVVYKHIIPEGLIHIDYEAINDLIAEQAAELEPKA